jgi:hypothetical protein
MPDIEWILFSKQRTLQAKSCLLSLTALSDVRPEEITVLYVESADIRYDELKRQLPCRYVRQQNFYQDVLGIVADSAQPLVGFLVDDLIFREAFSSREIIELMAAHPELDCFSLRLGRHIVDGPAPAFDLLRPGVLTWKTAPGLGRTWNYFWELSSSIYRRSHVLHYLHRCRPEMITFPNPMEYVYYRMMPNVYPIAGPALRTRARHVLWAAFCSAARIKKMACFEKSRAFTQGINLVADRGRAYDTLLEPVKLHALFLQGHVIDFSSLKDIANPKPNAGRAYFRLLGPDGAVHPASVMR